MWSALFLAICVTLHNGLTPVSCWKTCNENEEYVENVNPCNACKYLEGVCVVSGETGPGCDCKSGFYRNQDRVCVERSECIEKDESEEEEFLPRRSSKIGGPGPQTIHRTSPVRPPPFVCRDDEEFQQCGCLRTCCNKGRNDNCAAQCTQGCFCKPPLVRDDRGGCVRLRDCGKGNQTDHCGANEVYEECGTACPKTCANKNAAIKCISKCVKGCFCKVGYVRNDKGKCVKPNQCPTDVCGANEVYKDCGTACPKTCRNRNIKISCVDVCVEGCFCKDGYVRNDDGICVKPSQCPTDVCGVNEVYQECGTACPKTCANRNFQIRCIDKCVEGCFCREGYVRNDNGICVKPTQCPSDVCGANEVYKDCGTACPKTCRNRNVEIDCIDKCVEGCFCKDGYVRNEDGICVKPSQCPSDVCGANEVYKDCGTACPKTCANRNVEIYCIDKCVEGCFCKDGYVRNDDGKCVKPSQCPSGVCGANEEYKDCGTACPKTCKNRNIKISCVDVCVEGCFCKDGYVRNEDGICVRPSQCPEDTCGDDEEYNTCGTACPLTCENMDNPPPCVYMCVQGCFCKGGLVRNSEGRCVERYECPAGVCGENEVFKECGTACPKTCDNRNKAIKCIAKCVEGCFCKDGYVRNDDGICVKPYQCPAETCEGEGEEYTDCGSACPLTCDNQDDPPICIQLCMQGCFCKRGLVRDSQGRCVEPYECPPVVVTLPPIGECGKDEQFYECIPSCHRTCDALTRKTKIYCTQACRSGCFCREGLYQNKNGKCVPPEQCTTAPPTTQPGVCGKHEVNKRCGTACPETCSTRNKRSSRACTKQCVRGCFCEDGYVRNEDGKCVRPRDCAKPTLPPKCGHDEQFYKCVPDCNQTCEAYADKGRRACKTTCRSGCYCKKGLYKRKDGKCVKPSQCGTPTKHPESCPKNEVYSTCVNPCNGCEIRGQCEFLVCNKGCDCRKGYHREESGKCIPVSQCPIKNECGRNEEYKTCGTACQVTCSNRFYVRCSSKSCVEGCFCKEGYIRNDDGKCIEPSQCPPTNTCPINEEYSDCVNPCNDCETRGNCEFLVCNKGCDCKYGFYRDINGKCIPAAQCPIKEICVVEGEEYTDCGTACPLTCSNKDDPPVCTLQCVPGCFCRKGLVRDDKGRCVEPEKCPSGGVCPKNEEYVDCVIPCNDCETKGQCEFLVCNEGCDCKIGFYRDDWGKCIPESQCPIIPTLPPHEHCGKDEQFYDCIPACQRTCNVYTSEFPIACKQACRAGCFCKEGLYKRNDGKCVPPNKCPRPTKQPDVCGINEVFQTCGTACPDTCSNRGESGRVCTKQCVRGCFCKPGYVKNDQGFCVEPSECPTGNCGKNEEYSDCVVPCNDCETRGDCEFLVCNKGCDCKKNFYRDINGNCIPESQCPVKETCKVEGEEYTDCGTLCPLTCVNKDHPPPCAQVCVPGCFCRQGLVRNKEGKCVEPYKCPSGPTPPPGHECGKDEQFYECIPSCQGTCDALTRKVKIYCSQVCRSGCFCREGLYKNKDGKCVPPEQCSSPTIPTVPSHTCGVNEQYYRCKPTCKNTCENYNSKHSRCSRVCQRGCACKRGYVKRRDGKCVKPSQCTDTTIPTLPSTRRCGKDEEFYGCVPTCRNTCENYNSHSTVVCPLYCRSGCFCRKGLIKRKDGKCVKPDQCTKPTKPTKPTHTCGADEQYYSCVPTCKNTCENYNARRPKCTRICRPGCHCKKGLVKRKDGKCVKPSDCNQPTKPPTHHCDRDEQYYECTPDCKNTCANYNRPSVACPKICRRGCFCKEGLVKREDGKCVTPSKCTKPTKPPTHTCRRDEQYYECTPDCKNTCENYNRPDVICLAVCTRGCFCRKGLIKRKDGKCVKPSQCEAPTKPTKPPTCGVNEEYSGCISTCKNTCENYDAVRPICSRICIRGCHCKKGYVKRKDGKCVRPSQCDETTKPTKPPTCGVNEEYSGCIPTCKNTCENYDAVRPICSRICIRGCHCKKGYVKRKDGKCVRPSQCDEPTKPTKPPHHTCGKNEKYYNCVPTCKDTCKNYDDEHAICPFICRAGCACKEGYVKNGEGKCVKPSQCHEPTKPTKPPHHTCGKNEKYYNCVPTCKDTCENYDDEYPICLKYCRAGCACKEGYVKNSEGKCVKPSQCHEPTKPTRPPHHTCDKNEKYYNCVPTCKDTCKNYDDEHAICPFICRAGCACKEGYVKNSEGKCVKPSQCHEPTKPTKPPHHTCGKNEKYYNCVPTCKDTCENYDDEHPICPYYCRAGCACKEDYVKNSKGKCVKPSQCHEPTKPTKPPHSTCGKNEKYYNCVPTCKDTCKNYDVKHPICPLICRAGCACKENYVKNSEGKCVKPSQCHEPTKPTKPPHHTCGKDEQYYECVPTCKNTCENYDVPHPYCQLICRSGCACRKGLVKRNDGKCVKPSQCHEPTKPTKPPTHTCHKDEQYYECIPDCKNTCENCDRSDVICPAICKSGCFCREGLVKRKDGKCVKRSQCETPTKPTKPPTCGVNEDYSGCIPTCKNTCENYDAVHPICPRICVRGCHCKKGYVKRKDGKCVRPSQCDEPTKPTKPPTCGVNEEYSGCIPTCKNTCENYDSVHPICSKICIRGCHCKKGYVKRKDGNCVRPSQCDEPTKPPSTCGKDEVYYDECAPSCGGTCETYGKKPHCPRCRPGCWCKKGLVKNKDGKCIKPSKCHTTKPTKPPTTCGKDEVYYDECAPSCAGTCDTYGDHIIHCPLCRPGCWCKKGLVKNKDGKCIKPSKCHTTKPTKPPTSCGKDEVYYDECAPSCGGTCETYGNHKIFCPLCRPGCWCKKGLIKNKDGKCIKPSKCPNSHPTEPPTHSCGVDEKYYDCVPTCKDTCENYDDEYSPCPEYCRPGCACKEGLVKRKDGKCVKPSKCHEPTKTTRPPSSHCKKDEQFYKCVPSCKNTCDNHGRKHVLCPAICTSGCFCREGLVKRKDGKCVEPSKCPKTTGSPPITHKPTKKPVSCGKFEVYYDKCAPSCRGSCDTYNLDSIECPKCRPGCWCKKTLVKGRDGKCIPPIKCPSTKPTKPSHVCGKDEIYYDKCAPSCHGTCATLNRHNILCPLCRPGCWCKKGHVKNDEGKCIPSSKCPNSTTPTGCSVKQKYYECMPDCTNRCNPPDACAAVCRPGCFCKEGLVLREKDKRCVKKEFCDTHDCGKDKEFYDCYNSCRNSCASRKRKSLVCPAVCESGCFCRKGLLSNGKGKCVRPEECEKSGSKEWSESESYSSSEDSSREEWSKHKSRKHKHHHESGSSHTGKKCDGVNEAWVNCAKPKWCNTCGIRGNCKLSGCTPGCDCKENHYRDDKGVCIPASKCPKEKPPGNHSRRIMYPCLSTKYFVQPFYYPPLKYKPWEEFNTAELALCFERHNPRRIELEV